MRQPPRLPRQPGLGLPPCALRQNPAHPDQPTSPAAAAQAPQLMLRTVVTAPPQESRQLPAGFATLPLLPSAGAPVRAGRYASPSVRPHTSLPATVSARGSAASTRPHHDKPRLTNPRNAAASLHHGQHARQRVSTASDLLCENFLYWDQGRLHDDLPTRIPDTRASQPVLQPDAVCQPLTCGATLRSRIVLSACCLKIGPIPQRGPTDARTIGKPRSVHVVSTAAVDRGHWFSRRR
jgi:hypothetical protein